MLQFGTCRDIQRVDHNPDIRVAEHLQIDVLKLQARAKMPAALLNRPTGQGALIGTPETIRPRLAELEAVGVQELILGFPDALRLESLRFFAQEFMA